MPSPDLDDLSDQPPPLVLVEEPAIEPVLLGDDTDANDGGFLSMVPPGQPGRRLPGTQPPLPDGLGLPPADQSIFPPGQPGAGSCRNRAPPLQGLIQPPSGRGSSRPVSRART